MNILLVNDYGIPAGGAELGLRTLRDALRDRGHTVRVFASRAGTDRAESFADDECFGTTSRWRTLLQTANPWARAALRRTMEEFRPDVVHVRMFLTQLSPSILSLLADVPAVYDVVWYRPVCPTGLKFLPEGRPCEVQYGRPCYQLGCLPLRDWVPLMAQMRWWRRHRDVFDAVIAKSQDVKKRLGEAGIAPVEVIWDGVSVRAARPPLTGPPLAAFVGRLVPEKGVDVLLRAFVSVHEAVPEARLLIVGEGPARGALEVLAGALGLADLVTWTGHLPPVEMERCLDAAWVQVVPSRWAEPFGLVAIEAMMRGTAVVVTPAGGLGEIVVEGETGFHVPPDDVVALSGVMVRLLRGRDAAEQLGQAGRARALQHFTKECYVEKVLDLYGRIRAPHGGVS